MSAEPRVIDCLQLGQPRAIACWLIGDVIVDPGPESCLQNVLKGLDGIEPRAVLLTHIHLDHAGAAGTLARLYPNLQVYVHERGAPHMLDPSKLIASATRIYGEYMDVLWGKFEAVPEDRLTVLAGGETLSFDSAGSFEVLYTPGHAVHHVTYLRDEGTAFVGDVAATRPIEGGLVIPPTPPPDINLEDWQKSIELLRKHQPTTLAYTHYGSATDVEHHLDELSTTLTRWGELARDLDPDSWFLNVRAEMIHAGAGEDQLDHYLPQPTAQANYVGLRRYWDKRQAG
jgi:glyoxylase-like metal-dependent hydrolase (beta-lactamase superfamily II)